MTGKSIEQEIMDWSATRPAWQRATMRRLARGETITEHDVVDIADALIASNTTGVGEPLALGDMPRGEQQSAQIRLRGIRDLTHVNALLPNQTLDFAPNGLTVVYGDNGSGKSGYARLLKAVVRARDREEVRTDIFAERPTEPPSATLLVEKGGMEGEVSWPGSADELAAMGFYDEACGDKYLTTDTEISYRPSALAIFDGLIHACDDVRAVLDKRLAENHRRAARLPTLSADTPAGMFVASISASSDLGQLDPLCQLDADIDQRVQTLVAEEARSRTLDPAREQARLQALAIKLDRLGAHVVRIRDSVGPKVEATLASLHTALRTAESAGAAASARSFEGEALAGVGSSSWKILWEAARSYIAEAAGIGKQFPDTSDGARCALCQQELDAEAAARMRRFEDFVHDKVQARLAKAQREWTQAWERVVSLSCQPADVLALADDVGESHPAIAAGSRALLAEAADRQMALQAAAAEKVWATASIPPVMLAPLAIPAAAAELRAQANAIETRNHAEHLREIVAQRRSLEDGRTLAGNRIVVVGEVERLDQQRRIEAAKTQTSTNAISAKAAELLRAHVTAVVRDRFTRETERLQLDRVTLNDLGVRKGNLRHQAGFVGARQEAPLPRVLSEGEQTALGLAGFFTEAYLDASNATLVLDDPVCSLDHRRREKVAQRLAEFAKDRQVIVFTHDIAFVSDLSKAAEAAQVGVQERSVERTGTGKPGACRPHHPWSARDGGQRIEDVSQALAKLKADRADLDQAGYDARAADCAGKLSETWERILALEIVGQVFDPGTQEVHARMFRVLARITDTDDNEFQASYGRCSQWARRHDKSVAMNYVAPTVEEMQAELATVRAWFIRIKKYKNS